MGTETIVAIDGLTKRFGGVTAVDDLSFEVQRGQVYGLLGPNGAGKTTALRMLMGLERPTSGSSRLFGSTVGPGSKELFRVGAIIEQASFVPHMTGLRNLRLWWEAGGGRMEDADLDGALAVAGLDDAVHRKVKSYSQGMQQRLGFARALLSRPELLVLDEPTNGLDPGEIREVRSLIQRITARGSTVLFSSHHLSEVEQTCTHAVVMNRGRKVADGPVSSLIGSAGSAYLETDDPLRAEAVLRALDGVTSVDRQGDGLVVEQAAGRRADLAAALVAAGIGLQTLTARNRLEDAFLDLMAEPEVVT
ncbi:MAG: putative transporter ATP-binding protein [Acidimicrobiales bacterium]|nr:putative transporter ATP-binding protein [Acidimicrobiales bacterium]